MRKQIKIKQLVAILLPIVFILGIVYSISSMISLRADDSSTQLIVQKGDEDISGKDISISETSVNLKITAKANQLYRLLDNDRVSFSTISSDSKKLTVREVSSTQFDLEKELNNLNKEINDTNSSEKKDVDSKTKLNNELIRVTNFETREVITYIKLLKDETENFSFSREHVGEEVVVKLENVEDKSKQKLFTFTSPKIEKIEVESTDSKDTMNSEESDKSESKNSDPEPLRGDETVEELEKRKYSEEESFKPIELPIEATKATKATKTAASINVTGAKLSLRTGTGNFDGDNNPGHDLDYRNEWVRTFDSNVYLLTFSIEGSDPGVAYSDIKYRVDMDLPNAYGFDSSGKTRNNFSIVAENNGNFTVEGDGSKSENGYVESTINSNGQILLPIFVNVYGAQHNTPINPKIKITIISATNESTGTVETLDKVYDETNLLDEDKNPILAIPTTKVSAKASINTTLTKGTQKNWGDTVTGGTFVGAWRDQWQVAGLGVGLKLKELSGRAAGDFRGSTFPVGDIEFELATTKATFNGNDVPVGGTQESITTVYPVRIIAATSGTLSDDSSEWDWPLFSEPGRSLKIYPDSLSKQIPYGKGKQILTSEPTVADKTKLGAYDSGKITLSAAENKKVWVSNYEPIWNPYTYDMNGSPVSKNEKFFASASLLVEWSNLYLNSQSATNKNLTTDIAISSITYEGATHPASGTAQLAYNDDPGLISQHLVWSYANNNSIPGNSLGSQYSDWDARGDAKVSKGTKFDLTVRFSDQTAHENKNSVTYARWNANSAEYDFSRKVAIEAHQTIQPIMYGVKKSGVAPNNSMLAASAIEDEYTWFSTPEATVSSGKISAIKITKESWIPQDGYNVMIPVVAVGPIKNYRDTSGNPNIALINTWVYRKDGSVKFERPNNYTYDHGQFDSSGNPIPRNTSSDGPIYHGANTGIGIPDPIDATHKGSIGDTFWINGVSITTTTAPKQPIYKTDETVKWKVVGNVSGGDAAHTVRLTTTIPKGLEYVAGTATDGEGNNIEPKSTPIKNPDGTTTIVWEFDSINPAKSEIPEINFETKSVLKDLTFKDSSVAEVSVHTEGEIWIKSNPSEKDNSRITLRESLGTVQLYQMQKISLEKKVVPELIEVGDKDSAKPSLSTDIKYTIKLVNNSSDKLVKVNVLDALPYNGDSIKSSFNGSYTVTNLKLLKGNGKITYTNASIPGIENRNPNDITGWGTYVPESSDPKSIKDATAFLVSLDEMDVGEELEFEITISPTGQKAGDIYRNKTSFNSSIELPVTSNIVETKVFSRDLTGYVWYDDDYNGLINSGENPVGNIPVKLYRTSYENGSYTKELVKKGLTGQDFVDGNNDSLIKTGSDGKYKFENLPEGEYIAEFVIEDIVITKKIVRVTHKKVGSDDTLNSKADPDTFKTDEYDQPLLKDLPTLLTGTDKVHHITDVNAGLTRLSKIRLFKYEEGTVIDKNSNGTLEPEEIEASTTHALEGAEFQLYEGKSDDPDTIKDANKIGTVKVTGTDGWLEFDIGLPPGDYTIVETKAPPGFELLKDPIGVNVPTYNYVAVVHVADKGQTKLPFTGSTKAMRIILIAAAILMVVGMTSVFLHFRPINVKGGK